MTGIGDSRGLRRAFFSFAVVGIVASFALGIREVRDEPDFRVRDAVVQREGLVASVQVLVQNRTEVAMCPVVEIAARNRGGLDIARQTGAPVSGEGRLNAGQTVGFKAVFTDMTEADFERVADFVGYVASASEC